MRIDVSGIEMLMFVRSRRKSFKHVGIVFVIDGGCSPHGNCEVAVSRLARVCSYLASSGQPLSVMEND